nr:hypothetical protein [Tanacetum cinerariifolium]
GLYHKKNVDYAYLIWEDFVYQVEHKNHKKSNEMYYPRFTKAIIYHFMSMDPSILRRNKTHISQASGSSADEGTGSIPGVPDVPSDEFEEELSWNFIDDEGEADEGKDGDGDEEDEGDDGEEGDGAAPPKPKASVQRTRSSFDTSITPPTTATGVPDVPTDESEEEISWNSTDEEGDDDEGKDS